MKSLRTLFALGLFTAVCACTSAGSDDPAPSDPTAGGGQNPPPPVTQALSFDESASLLLQGTFGASMQDIGAVENTSASAWVEAQFSEPMTLHLPRVLQVLPGGLVTEPGGDRSPYADGAAVDSFLDAAVRSDDQLRQRTAYALSQILVVSGAPSAILHRRPHVQAAYMDILVRNAFGNYRDLLEEVTYSPAMALYLTYHRNEKANPLRGSLPDENYAREVMQLFTIGLVELNMDGTPRLQGGRPIETYTNDDIVGLSRVFTGFSYDAPTFWHAIETTPELAYAPLTIFDEKHSTEVEKSFLGTTIPVGTGGAASVDIALDALFNHPNVAPFVSKQLIQRLVTSNPKPAYVARVAQAFESGSFTMPNGTTVGEGRRGDLRATIAAILLDAEARTPALRNDPAFGKVREPYVRFTHWARTFDVNVAQITNQDTLWNAETSDRLSQLPLRAPSVFNFYRPGYAAPGTQTGQQGLVAPELQLLDATSIVGYNDVMATYIFITPGTRDGRPNTHFIPDYTDETALAADPQALVDHLDALLAGNRLEASTKTRMADMISAIEIGDATREDDLLGRAELAIFLAMTAPEYLVQR